MCHSDSERVESELRNVSCDKSYVDMKRRVDGRALIRETLLGSHSRER